MLYEVITPVPTVLATALPEIEPMSPLPNTAILAGPPTDRPVMHTMTLLQQAQITRIGLLARPAPS